MWSILPEISWSAISNRSMSSDFTSALTSPKVRRSLRVSSPSMVNIDCDQKIRPRDRSQSHNPQRPRLSAVSIRPRTASLMRSPSRARVDCQWKAKPRISTTKPVVADSVTDSAASDPQSGSIFSWMTMTWPGSDLTSRADRQRAVAVRQDHVGDDALLAGGGEQLRRADRRRARGRFRRGRSRSGTRASTRWSAPVMMT